MPPAGALPIDVYSYPVDRKSTYVPLLFEGIEDAYRAVYRQDGTVADAIGALDAGRTAIVHVHWEEFVLRECRSAAEADAATATFLAELAALRERSAALVWTVHNEWPHELPYREQFLTMRRALAREAGAVLVHDGLSREVLAAQLGFAPSHARVLPHPSYLGRYEDEATSLAGLRDEPRERRILAFGWIRRQKGYAAMIGMLPATYLASRDAFVQVSGSGPEAAAVMAEVVDRADVRWDVRHVPDAETPALLRSAACVVLPYERVLTSGVALLAMSVGALVVAADFPQLRELLPATNHRFLYPPGDGDALRGALDGVFALSRAERHDIVQANFTIARERRPSAIARRLAAIYDDVLARSFANNRCG